MTSKITEEEKNWLKRQAEFGIGEGSLEPNKDFNKLYEIMEKIQTDG